MTLKALIDSKKAELIYIDAAATVLDAINNMTDKQVGSLLIRDQQGRLSGILTERDILRFCARHSSELSSTLVGDIMTRNPVTAPAECSAEEAMTLMTNRRFRHLPIVEEGEILGMVSIGDLVKSRLKDVTVEVKYLRDYISA
ncbi:MAG: CBS domain-containing protein [Gammaproteobacteria bacterium]|nr:CBS domain-containing protein [Gammaproteobacteria bacterium]